MLDVELINLIKKIVQNKSESNNIEIIKVKTDCSLCLYETLSSFSNTNGGIIIFGIDEKDDYKVCGVDNIDLIQKKVTEQSLMMEPNVRIVFTICQFEGKNVISAEIPELDAFSKPCYYKGKGKAKGSYIRVGDADLPMTDYEIYNYDCFKYKTEDELRVKPRIDSSILNEKLINVFINKITEIKPNLLNVDNDTILKLNGIIDKDGVPTVNGIMNFGKYPQILSPNLDIVAVKCATDNYGVDNKDGIRFIDNKRLDGTISEMLKLALSFIINNMKKATIINKFTGNREDEYEYPIIVLREIILNALIHRDYSIHTENDPIRIEMYFDRLVISSPGGLYGRINIDDLGEKKADVRNPFIASVMEILENTENRYSGIPTIINAMKQANLMAPKFEDNRGTFVVTLFNKKIDAIVDKKFIDEITEFCKTPRSKNVLADHFKFDMNHPAYFIKNIVVPLIEQGILEYTIPDKPKSKNQKIVTKNLNSKI